MPRDNRPRQRVSQACIPCGSRKTKCDGTLPSCNQCVEHLRRCHYGISKRNKTRRSSLILGDGSHHLSSRLAECTTQSKQSSQQTDQSAPTSTSDWARNEDTSSVLAGLHGSRRNSNRQDDPAVSSVVSARLFSAYFANIHPIWPILYMPMHDYGNSNLHSDAFAPAVLYAVYAIAACSEPVDPSVSIASEDKTPAPAVFFEAALLALQKREGGQSPASTVFHPLNFIRPSIESCQTLVILALQQHGLGDASNAAMLCNIAGGMAIDLRLNEARPPDADYISTQVASRLWWNLYILDKVLACGLGRPVSLRSEDVTMQYPSAAESDEYQLLQFCRPKDGAIVRIKSHTMSGFALTIRLCLIMEDILRETCSVTSKQRICEDLAAAEAARMRLWHRLESCNEALKCSNIGLMANGSFRPVVPPVAIINAVWLYASTILIHRPFHFYWRENNWSPASQIPLAHTPIRVCLAAAKELCTILSAYVDDLTRLPCDIIYPIVLAAATLWQHSGEFDGRLERVEAQQNIDLCVKCLSILGKSWKNAGDCRRRLIRDFAGTTPTNAVNEGSNNHQRNAAYGEQSARPSVPAPAAVENASAVAQDSVETPSTLTPLPADTTYPFLDTLGPRLDEFTTSDEGFRAYLEAQLGQYEFPDF